MFLQLMIWAMMASKGKNMALFWHDKGYFHFGVLGESVLQSSRYSLRARRDLEFPFSFTLMDLPVDSKKYNCAVCFH